MEKTKFSKLDPFDHTEYKMDLNLSEAKYIDGKISLLVDREHKMEAASIRDLSPTAEVGVSLRFIEKIGVAILELEQLKSAHLSYKSITTNVEFTTDELLTIREIATYDPFDKNKPGNTLKLKVLKLLFEDSLKEKIKTSKMLNSINKKEDGNE